MTLHTCGEKFPLMSMGGQAEGLARGDPVARTPIGLSGFLKNVLSAGSMYFMNKTVENKLWVIVTYTAPKGPINMN